MLIDTHCHLDAPVFDSWRDQCVADARRVGIGKFIVPAVCASGYNKILALQEQYGFAIALGLHPLYLASHQSTSIEQLKALLSITQVVAVGEIGLDRAKNSPSLSDQELLFIEQLRLARQFDLPVLLHVRYAIDLILKYLRRFSVCGGIAHAFNGSEQQAKMFIDMGFKLGFGGAVTYSGSSKIRRLAATLPDESIVLETDAPDIPPAWAPGQINCPSNLLRIAQVIASLRGQTVDQLARQTSQNAKSVLRLS